MVLWILVRQIGSMKSLHLSELEKLTSWIFSRIEGAQLQEVFAHERGLILGLYQKETSWLILDLSPTAPFLAWIPSEKSPWPKTKLTKPTGLFLNSHAKNLYLTDISIKSGLGRAVQIVFQNKTQSCEIELQLIPRRPNLKVSAEAKTVTWSPWKELDQTKDLSSEVSAEGREPELLIQEWLQSLKSPAHRAPVHSFGIETLQKDLRKKTKAIDAIETTIKKNQKDSEVLYRLGEELKHKSVESFQGTENEVFLNLKRSSSWNREHCFTQAKANIKKVQGAQSRLEILKNEIHELEEKMKKVESGELSLSSLESDKKALGKHKILKGEGSVRSRKKILPSGLVVFLGKSAKDNLALLRRARAWDYWMHLRDYPGSHAIVHREKNQNFSMSEMQEVATWLAEESLSAKTLQNGIRLDVIVAEARFVRPIKGDKAGQVNYHSEKIFQFKYEKKMISS